VIKYLILDSVVDGVDLVIRMGIILIKLISRPSQHENQDEEEAAIIVPDIRVIR